MNRISKKHSILSLVLLLALIAAMALSVVSCGNDSANQADTTAQTTDEAPVDTTTEPSSTEIGNGQTIFTFNVKFLDGTARSYTVNTDKTTVGDALDEAGLIEYTNGQFGRYVTHVCGEKNDTSYNGAYWSFLINGEYAMAGVDSTEIKSGEVYSFEAVQYS